MKRRDIKRVSQGEDGRNYGVPVIDESRQRRRGTRKEGKGEGVEVVTVK